MEQITLWTGYFDVNYLYHTNILNRFLKRWITTRMHNFKFHPVRSLLCLLKCCTLSREKCNIKKNYEAFELTLSRLEHSGPMYLFMILSDSQYMHFCYIAIGLFCCTVHTCSFKARANSRPCSTKSSNVTSSGSNVASVSIHSCSTKPINPIWNKM